MEVHLTDIDIISAWFHVITYENETKVTYDQIPSIWGETYDITDYMKYAPLVSILLILASAIFLYWKYRKY